MINSGLAADLVRRQVAVIATLGARRRLQQRPRPRRFRSSFSVGHDPVKLVWSRASAGRAAMPLAESLTTELTAKRLDFCTSWCLPLSDCRAGQSRQSETPSHARE